MQKLVNRRDFLVRSSAGKALFELMPMPTCCFLQERLHWISTTSIPMSPTK